MKLAPVGVEDGGAEGAAQPGAGAGAMLVIKGPDECRGSPGRRLAVARARRLQLVFVVQVAMEQGEHRSGVA